MLIRRNRLGFEVLRLIFFSLSFAFVIWSSVLITDYSKMSITIHVTNVTGRALFMFAMPFLINTLIELEDGFVYSSIQISVIINVVLGSIVIILSFICMSVGEATYQSPPLQLLVLLCILCCACFVFISLGNLTSSLIRYYQGVKSINDVAVSSKKKSKKNNTK